MSPKIYIQHMLNPFPARDIQGQFGEVCWVTAADMVGPRQSGIFGFYGIACRGDNRCAETFGDLNGVVSDCPRTPSDDHDMPSTLERRGTHRRQMTLTRVGASPDFQKQRHNPRSTQRPFGGQLPTPKPDHRYGLSILPRQHLQ